MTASSIKDLHVCGTCKNIFSDVRLFLEHKTLCFVPENREENAIYTTDVGVDNGLFTNQCILDPVNLNNGVLPFILQFDIEEAETSMPEVCHPREEECAKNSQEGEECANKEEIVEDLTKLCMTERLKEIKKVVLETVKEADSEKEKKNACRVCDFVTNRHHDFIRHMLKHSGKRPYECYICDKKFTRQDKLLEHKRVHYGDKRYKCQFCEYASPYGGALKVHLRIHSDLRTYKCQICSYKARNASHLIVHLRTHTGDCPFICQLASCGRAFKTSSDLKRHMKVHKRMQKDSVIKSLSQEDIPDKISSNHVPRSENTVKQSTCFGCKEFCQKGVSKKGRGRRRQGGHVASLKTHQCPYCSASFVRQDSLNSHLRQHPQSSRPPDTSSYTNEDGACPAPTEPAEEQLIEPFLSDQELLSLDSFVTVPCISDGSVL